MPAGHCKERRRHRADHTSTLNTVNTLGKLYGNQGKLYEAEKMYRRALQGEKRKNNGQPPSGHMRVVSSIELLNAEGYFLDLPAVCHGWRGREYVLNAVSQTACQEKKWCTTQSFHKMQSQRAQITARRFTFGHR